jgi:phosphoenolpyruvate-protein phosphotransferase (PTS system enzyme I)
MPPNVHNEIILYGIGGSPGICIGRAYLVDKGGVDVLPKYTIEKEGLNQEVKRFKAAVKKASDELRKIISDTSEDFSESAHILETHVALLKDKLLYAHTIEIIQKDRINAEWALKRVISDLRPMFESLNDAYLRERGEDILHVSDRIMKCLAGSEGVRIGDIAKRVILVARDLSPAETSQIQLERVMGFVTDRGGRASHTSIIARSLEIPAVLGLENATNAIHNDDIIIVDGTAGVVIVNPSERALIEAEERRIAYEARRAHFARDSHLPAETRDGLRMAVMGNIEMPEEVVSVLDKGGDGIGLYRTEFQYLARDTFPSEDELVENYIDVLDVMGDRPVTIRTLDINGDKVIAGTEQDESNPVLGLRAIRYCLQRPDIFKTQLRAILRAAIYGRVRILIPMISRVEEVIETKRILAEAAHSLKKDGIAYNNSTGIGVMIEVPSAALAIDIIAPEVDFLSIGTNDLIQYTMAIDRGNRHVAYLYNPLHPVVLHLIKKIADAGQRHRVPVFMCGEMAGEPIYAPILLGLGLQELSTNPQAIPAVKSAIRQLDIVESRRFLDRILAQSTTEQVEDLLFEDYGHLFNHNNHKSWGQ